MAFQRQRLRASKGCYTLFTLAMGRSPGFGSIADDRDRAIRTRFRYGSVP